MENMPQTASLEKAQEKLDIFLDNIKTVILSTVSSDGEPFASHSPFVQDEDGNFYVFISTSVQHSHNMYNTGKAHILFLEDESLTKHIYARRRLYFRAHAEKFDENDERTEKIAQLFEERFGKQASLVRSMPSSRFYKLSPYDGNFVIGFGAAYKLDDTNKKVKELNTMNGNAHGDTHELGLKKDA
ncbi:HugZ family protein [Aliarcobacter vitoriensis]|uniref:Pyridoxamine 5-phosphate oxidase n=1 Tax=Aliarcobacter vitoriensis TaxID=2011099 RepID=A0A366MQU8_9BACT|nr:pyridoxamine 5'-phosphate oxidase family protein [Aliarcobacter vitoriensis]RBQ28661.1 pyridoxamine 5-phosphate oxidase [Aliarcobacter vitoriensis]RBQ31598.1 pyridoxamine 5-phosphate oxidase [Arcobacter sp. FW59]